MSSSPMFPGSVYFRSSRFAMLSSAALGVLACSDDLTQEPDSFEVIMDPDEGCRGDAIRVDPNDTTDLGTRPLDVATEFSGTFLGEWRWNPPSGPVMHEFPTSTEPQVSIELDIESEGAQFVESEHCSHASCSITCVSRLQLTATIGFRTDDGILDETFSGFVGATEDEAAILFFSHPFDPSMANGKMADMPIEVDQTWTPIGYRLEAEFSEDPESRGRLLFQLSDPAGLVWYTVIGLWPPPPSESRFSPRLGDETSKGATRSSAAHS